MTDSNPWWANRKCALLAILIGFMLIQFVASSELIAQEGPDIVGAEAMPNAGAVEDDAAPPPVTGKKQLSFLDLLVRGGWFMIPLGLLSVAIVTIGIERFLSLRREKLFPQALVTDLAGLSRGPGGLDPRKAYQLCQQHPSSASQIIRSMLTRVGRPQLELEHAVNEATEREANRLTSLGSWLTLAAAIAPLIGLLGTVWGITQAFYDTTQLVAGQNRAEALAQGIYTALVTTMCGLLIAIPAAVMAHFFENRIITVLNEIEEMISSLLPQFEKYEGQLRFTTGVTSPNGEDLDDGGDDSDSKPLRTRTPALSVNGPKKRKRTNVPDDQGSKPR